MKLGGLNECKWTIERAKVPPEMGEGNLQNRVRLTSNKGYNNLHIKVRVTSN